MDAYERYMEYKNKVDSYGDFSHILTINPSANMTNDEKDKILSDINNLMNALQKENNIKWRTIDLCHYYNFYSDGNMKLEDNYIYLNTKTLVTYIRTVINIDNITIYLNKPCSKTGYKL